jgi:hypothetical protein
MSRDIHLANYERQPTGTLPVASQEYDALRLALEGLAGQLVRTIQERQRVLLGHCTFLSLFSDR